MSRTTSVTAMSSSFAMPTSIGSSSRRMLRSSMPTAPKSISVIVPRPPARRGSRLPGCRSAWNTPRTAIWSNTASSSESAIVDGLFRQAVRPTAAGSSGDARRALLHDHLRRRVLAVDLRYAHARGGRSGDRSAQHLGVGAPRCGSPAPHAVRGRTPRPAHEHRNPSPTRCGAPPRPRVAPGCRGRS